MIDMQAAALLYALYSSWLDILHQNITDTVEIKRNILDYIKTVTWAGLCECETRSARFANTADHAGPRMHLLLRARGIVTRFLSLSLSLSLSPLLFRARGGAVD
jgi:hypothetical protein